eukprot:evm.model.NODE_47216_length_6161_cov_17.441000.1
MVGSLNASLKLLRSVDKNAPKLLLLDLNPLPLLPLDMPSRSGEEMEVESGEKPAGRGSGWLGTPIKQSKAAMVNMTAATRGGRQGDSQKRYPPRAGPTIQETVTAAVRWDMCLVRRDRSRGRSEIKAVVIVM